MFPFNNIRSKNNRAIAAYLISMGCGTQNDTFAYENRQIKTYPNTVVRSGVGKPEVQFSGLWRISTHISIKGSASLPAGAAQQGPNAQDPRVAFDARLAAVFDAMMQSNDGGQSLDATVAAITVAGRALAVAPPNATADQIAFAQKNADMADYTCMAVYDSGFGDGEASDDGCAWEEILLFEIVVAGSAIS